MDKKKEDYGKKYYDLHKDEIKEKMKEKVKCECGYEYTRYNKRNHEKTQKHRDGIENKNDNNEIIENMNVSKIKDKVINEKLNSLCSNELLNEIKEKLRNEICRMIEINVKK
jgi:hypothetical protein